MGSALKVRVQQVEAPEDLLDVVPTPFGLSTWLGNEVQIVAWGEAWVEEFVGERPTRAAARRWEEVARECDVTLVDEGNAPRFRFPIAMGTFGFSDSTPGYLVVPEVAFVRDDTGTWLVTATTDDEPLNEGEVSQIPTEDVQSPAGLWTDRKSVV